VLQEIEIKNLNHLGIIAGIVDELEIVKLINQELGIEEQEIVYSGEIVKAIILNGLGFVSKPWYLFPKFFEYQATEHLLGQRIKPESLNEHKIGRVMDKLYEYKLSELFLLISKDKSIKIKIKLIRSLV
jgi:transposase